MGDELETREKLLESAMAEMTCSRLLSMSR